MSDHEMYVAAFGEPVAAHISKLIEAERGSSEPRELVRLRTSGPTRSEPAQGYNVAICREGGQQ